MRAAQRILDYHLERKKTGHVPDYMMAVIYASLDDVETSLDYLEKSIAVQGENWFILGFEKDPMLDPVRNHSRFKEMMKTLKHQYQL